MALVSPAKACLWAALRFLRAKKYPEAKKAIEEAMLFLELTHDMIDPGMKQK
jgi:hypothetical protein